MIFIPRVAQPPANYSPPQVAFSTQAIFNTGWDGKGGLDEWQAYQAAHVQTPMEPGAGFQFFAKYLALNKCFPASKRTMAQAHIVSRASAEFSLRVLNTFEHYGFDRFYELGLSSSHFLNGQDPTKTIQAFQALKHGLQLYLTTNPEVARDVIKAGFAAAVVAKDQAPLTASIDKEEPLILALDGDAVIFGDASEAVYQKQSLAAFNAQELRLGAEGVSMVQGPLHPFLIAMYRLRALFESDPKQSPLLLKLYTARGHAGQRRVMNTIKDWGVQLDHVSFLVGAQKGSFLNAGGADIFFDDSKSHVSSARKHHVMAAHVPFGIKNQ